MHNEECHDFVPHEYYSGDQIMADEMDEAWGMYGGDVKCIQEFGGGPGGKRLPGRHWHRWEDNIEINFKKWDGRL